MFKGQGIGGFIGGQLVDSAGISLPLLFKLTAGFLIVWTIIFYFVYTMLCQKYEERLIQQKEEEIYSLQVNKEQHGSTLSTIDQSQTELRQRHTYFNRSANTKSTIELEEASKYWGSQIVGMTRL